MLREFGADIRSTYEIGSTKATAPSVHVRICTDEKITVPGDISSAAYFIAAGLIVPDSEILIEIQGINRPVPEFLKVVRRHGW